MCMFVTRAYMCLNIYLTFFTNMPVLGKYVFYNVLPFDPFIEQQLIRLCFTRRQKKATGTATVSTMNTKHINPNHVADVPVPSSGELKAEIYKY